MFVDTWKPEMLDLLKHVGGSATQCGHWELNGGPQAEQGILLASETHVQP